LPYKQKWLNHVSRMEDIRYPKQLLDYRIWGRIRKRFGWPLDYKTDIIVRPKCVIYWPNFVTRRKRKSNFMLLILNLAEVCFDDYLLKQPLLYLAWHFPGSVRRRMGYGVWGRDLS
jgi:hypothetical protein